MFKVELSQEQLGFLAECVDTMQRTNGLQVSAKCLGVIKCLQSCTEITKEDKETTVEEVLESE